MRIVIITGEYPPRIIGDIASYVERLASILEKGGLDVVVVTFHDCLRGLETRVDGVKVYRVGNPVEPHLNILTWDLTFAAELERVVSDIYYSVRGEIDLIDAHEWLSIVPSTIMKKAFKIPFIYTLHSLEEHRSYYSNSPLNIAIKNLERLGSYESRRLLVKSKWMKAEVKKLHNIADEKIVSISPSIPTWPIAITEFYTSVVTQ